MKTQMNLLLYFWADCAVRALLKNSAVLQKYPTVAGGFLLALSYLRVSVVCTKKLFIIKVRNEFILCARA